MKEWIRVDGDWLQVVEIGRSTVTVISAHFLLMIVPKYLVEGWRVR